MANARNSSAEFARHTIRAERLSGKTPAVVYCFLQAREMLGTKSIAPSHIVINVTVRQNKVLHDRRQKELTATRLAAGNRSRRGTTFDVAEGDAALGEVIR